MEIPVPGLRYSALQSCLPRPSSQKVMEHGWETKSALAFADRPPELPLVDPTATFVGLFRQCTPYIKMHQDSTMVIHVASEARAAARRTRSVTARALRARAHAVAAARTHAAAALTLATTLTAPRRGRCWITATYSTC